MTTPQAFVNLHIVQVGESRLGEFATMVQGGYDSSISVLSQGKEGRVEGQVCESTVVLLLEDGVPIVASGRKLANFLLAAEVRKNRRKSRFLTPFKRRTRFGTRCVGLCGGKLLKVIATTHPSWGMLAMSDGSALAGIWRESASFLLPYLLERFFVHSSGRIDPWTYFTEN
jgi:hypothetical protein